jgi:hypothetical protein
LAVLIGAAILFALIVAERDSLVRRAQLHADQALIHAAASQADSDGADVVEGKAPSPLKAFFDPSYGGYLRASSARNAARFDYHASLQDKYERAARYPWQPMTADPPPP